MGVRHERGVMSISFVKTLSPRIPRPSDRSVLLAETLLGEGSYDDGVTWCTAAPPLPSNFIPATFHEIVGSRWRRCFCHCHTDTNACHLPAPRVAHVWGGKKNGPRSIVGIVRVPQLHRNEERRCAVRLMEISLRHTFWHCLEEAIWCEDLAIDLYHFTQQLGCVACRTTFSRRSRDWGPW